MSNLSTLNLVQAFIKLAPGIYFMLGVGAIVLFLFAVWQLLISKRS